MKGYNGRFFYCLVVALIGYTLNNLKLSAIFISVIYLFNLIVVSKDLIAFREYTLGIYSINYLLSPAVLYEYNGADFLPYTMKCSEDQYFLNALIGVLSLHLGIFIYNSPIFKSSFSLAKIQSKLNSKVLRTWVYGGLAIGFITSKVPFAPELVFFLILLSGLRYVGVFGLLSLDSKKFRYEIIGVFIYEIYTSISWGFFHDLMIWLIFLGIYYVYIKKISLASKILGALIFIICAYVIQNVKGEYRSVIWRDGFENNEIDAFTETARLKADDETFLSKEQVLQTLVRINQGWIFASTMDNMDKTQNFAGTELVSKYFEAALLPRFLAPDKLQAGDKELFNKYSGHHIANNTSMALGILADGYISYGTYGVFLFCFFLGVCFCIIFYLVERWSNVSPYFSLMLFPILYYAVRPDCETQVTLGQLVKGTFAFWLIVLYYKNYFKKQTKLMERIEQILEIKKQEFLQRRITKRNSFT